MTSVAGMVSPVPSELWTAEEREAWRPPPHLKPSQWAERFRVLSRDQSSMPGPWRNDAAPYLRAVMDLAVAPGVVQLNVIKCAQAGASEATRNLIGYLAHLAPDPVGLALPDRSKGRKIIRERVLPLFRSTPALRALIPARRASLQAENIRLLNGFLLHLMWSGSASSLASDPMLHAIADEVDKMVQWTGREADPVSLLEKRLRSYGARASAVNVSTPTTRAGRIWQLAEGSEMTLYFLVPCPRCGAYQRLVFTQLHWLSAAELAPDDPKRYGEPKRHAAALLRRAGAVWYECLHCRGRIEESERRGMVLKGRWATEDGSIEDAEAVERWPEGTRLALHISGLYVLWTRWADVAAERLRASGDPSRTFDFYTQTLGEPFEEQIDHAPTALFSRLAGEAELDEGRLPEWAVRLIATIDTQSDHFWCVLRAWGPGLRSQRVWHGRLATFEELDTLLWRTRWPFAGDAWPASAVDLALIDTGGTRLADDRASRTMEVYRWALGRSSRVRAIKGASQSRPGAYVWMSRGFLDTRAGRPGLSPGGRPGPTVPLWFIDRAHFADELAEAIHAAPAIGLAGAPEAQGVPVAERRWFLNRRDDPEYSAHLASMHKVLLRTARGLRSMWIEKPSGARHDYWDCELYQFAAAYMALVHLLPGDDAVRAARLAQAAAAAPPAEPDAAARQERSSPWVPRPLKT